MAQGHLKQDPATGHLLIRSDGHLTNEGSCTCDDCTGAQPTLSVATDGCDLPGCWVATDDDPIANPGLDIEGGMDWDEFNAGLCRWRWDKVVETEDVPPLYPVYFVHLWCLGTGCWTACIGIGNTANYVCTYEIDIECDGDGDLTGTMIFRPTGACDGCTITVTLNP